MDSKRLTHVRLPDVTPENDLDSLAAIYRFIIECHESKKAADASGDRNEVKEARNIDPEQRLPR